MFPALIRYQTQWSWMESHLPQTCMSEVWEQIRIQVWVRSATRSPLCPSEKKSHKERRINTKQQEKVTRNRQIKEIDLFFLSRQMYCRELLSNSVGNFLNNVTLSHHRKCKKKSHKSHNASQQNKQQEATNRNSACKWSFYLYKCW